MKQYRIKSLKAENVLRLKAVEITVPDGESMVSIGGMNGQGKTSVLAAIEMALAGKDSFPGEPVRRGEEKATIILDLGDIIVERVIRASGYTQLVVKNKDGARYDRPQELLDALQTKLSFDPMEFVRLAPVKQRETLRQLVGIDFTALDKQRAEAYVARTEANKSEARLAGEVAAIVVPEGTPDEAPDVDAVAAKYREAHEIERQRAALRSDCQKIGDQISDWPAARVDLENSIKAMQKRLNEGEVLQNARRESLKELILKIEALPIVLLSDIEAEGKRLRAVAADVAKKKLRAEREIIRVSTALAATNLTNAIEEIDTEKQRILAAAKFPVAGLAFSEKGVTFNGIPFEQSSSAEQIRVSVAMGRALNPSLRIMLVRNGSLLDKSSMTLLAEEAEKNELQVWVEVVDDGEAPSVIIEDGEVKSNRMEQPTQIEEEIDQAIERRNEHDWQAQL